MNVKTVCPKDCPGRFPGCGQNCPKFQAHRKEREKVYAQKRANVEISEVLNDGFMKNMRGRK